MFAENDTLCPPVDDLFKSYKGAKTKVVIKDAQHYDLVFNPSIYMEELAKLLGKTFYKKQEINEKTIQKWTANWTSLSK